MRIFFLVKLCVERLGAIANAIPKDQEYITARNVGLHRLAFSQSSAIHF